MKFRTEGSVITLAMFLIIFVAAAFLAAVERSVSGKPYDERQELAQGKAAQGGFLTMALFDLGMLFLLEIFETAISHELVLWCGLYLGILVYATIAIWKDAYITLTQSYEQGLLSLGLLAVFRWVRFMGKLPDYTFTLEDTECWIEVGAVVIFTWVTGLLAVKWILKKKEESEVE